MVLQGGPCGRVGRRRTIIPKRPPSIRKGVFLRYPLPMQNLTLTWQSAGGAAVGLYGGAYVAARVRKPGMSALLREAGTLLALFALWQLVGHLSVMSADHALDRASWIHGAERVIGLPDEASWQAAITPYPVLVRLANYYYAVMHFAV